MKNLTKEQFQNLPAGFQESISERSQIHAAIANANTFKKYASKCLRYHKENPHQQWDEQAKNSLLPYYQKLLEVEPLANKYRELWQEKFYRCKLQCEKILNI